MSEQRIGNSATPDPVQPEERPTLPVDPRYARKREIDGARPATRKRWWAARKAPQKRGDA